MPDNRPMSYNEYLVSIGEIETISSIKRRSERQNALIREAIKSGIKLVKATNKSIQEPDMGVAPTLNFTRDLSEISERIRNHRPFYEGQFGTFGLTGEDQLDSRWYGFLHEEFHDSFRSSVYAAYLGRPEITHTWVNATRSPILWTDGETWFYPGIKFQAQAKRLIKHVTMILDMQDQPHTALKLSSAAQEIADARAEAQERKAQARRDNGPGQTRKSKRRSANWHRDMRLNQ